jgi:hypothetical protein
MDNQYEYDGFWESLDDIIEELFAEIDRMIASGWKKQQIPKGQHRLGNHPRVETNEQNKTGVVRRSVGKPREPDGTRRPQEKDEYWSTSPTTWSLTPHARREVLSHVGRINETSEGEQAPDSDCKKCAKVGAECMVYRNEPQRLKVVARDHADHACSLCRFRGMTCSFEMTGSDLTTISSPKTVRAGVPMTRQSKRVRHSKG